MEIKISSNTFKQQKSKRQNFEQEKSLSQGPNSRVMRIEHQGIRKTLKRVPKDQTLNEIKILQQLDHPNILKLYEFYEDNNEYCLITDYWEGGDLYEYLCKHDEIDEYDMAQIMKQLFSILHYIHSKKIVHRDIKSENILVEKQEDGCILIKMIDWGIATQFQNGSKLYTTVGTPYYMAPEVFKQCYDEKCDIWSSGILLYEIVTGNLPFYARQADEIQRKILDTKPNFDLPVFQKCSPELNNLVRLLLNKDPEKRPSAKELLDHEFFQLKKERKASQEFNTCFQESVSRLIEFRVKNKLQQAVLSFMGSFQQTPEEERQLIRIFNEIDVDRDGKLTCDELAMALQKIYMYDELQAQMQASILMEQIDIDNNGFLEYSEFIMACSQRKVLLTESNLKNAFQQFDLNGDGVISVQEIKKVLEGNESITDEKWQEVIQEVDTNGDGEVSYEEFLVMMKQLL
ncbi:unnamed protein product (macronuclear) [Paramecium tetraurelia]|uniref:Protein kinase domain containing protein n=1 Tax=Paramecium tetraurelia TaxID=5888 RepID=A0CPP6_PARTE|nr:uncharacterized protein GSPATT00009155001 [Paramecium tetraurelia]CAK72763.1 unnamed protein product [Paramecium tetraurelia]|eukprot:XP_001440160.1 hypothetical protein (macronuclear) [Paramecium tetraurelia strain d4-2]